MSIKLPWLETAYQLFSEKGPQSLKVESLAKAVGKNKSSFYHHFADMEIFTRRLLDYHYERSKEIAKREAACQAIDPDLIYVLMESKVDILFSKQLRLHSANPDFSDCFDKVSNETSQGFMKVWMRELELEGKSQIAHQLYELSQDNFYVQINEENLNYEWLSSQFKGIKEMVLKLKKSNSLNGTV